MFLAQTVANGGFPSEIKNNSRAEYNPYEALTEENLLAKLKRSREHCEEGKYREADKVVSDLSMEHKAIIMNCMERWCLVIYLGS